ncbi:MAG: sigma-54 dependent transcriptional regulator [Candidatus Korobacteraceae bacterium]
MMKPHVLIVDDEANLRRTLVEVMSAEGYESTESSSGKEALQSISGRRPDIVFCDWMMPNGDGQQLLEQLRDRDLLRVMPVVIITAHGTSQNAIQAMQLGAYDFVSKPFDLDEICATAKRAIQHARLQQEVEQLREKLGAEGAPKERQIVGSSRAMLEVFKAVGRVAHTDTAVLILGESGTGKELVARAIHENSQRSKHPFVVVNCAALPHDLLESELFGHEKGAFTGAITQKQGRFETATGGTVFLDEIGELPLALQPKLLRVLQEHSFERVGGNTTIHADFRMIAATNRDLEAEVQEGDFRQDLYFRLTVFTIALPPLRARRADIVPLAEHFLEVFSARNSLPISGFAEDAILALQQHSFPGNVRELEHMIETAVVNAGGRVITADHLRPAYPASDNNVGNLSSLLGLPFHQSVAEWEKRLIMTALQQANGNKAEAARKLGMHRRLLYEKLKQFGLE